MILESHGILVTATDTGAGKTFISSLLLKQLGLRGFTCCGMKPVASGCDATPHGLRNADALELMQASGIPLPYSLVNRYAFAAPVSPNIAGARAGVQIEPDRIRQDLNFAMQAAEIVIVEGVGGWKVPLTEKWTFEDLAVELALPIILVVGIRLGCINHAILSADAIIRSGLQLVGWVANFPTEGPGAEFDVIETIRARIPRPLMGVVHHDKSTAGGNSAMPDLAAILLELTEQTS